MGQLDKYLMKVDDFDANFVSSLGLLRDSEEFFDVTLVSDDEIPIQAHKVVLSASSPFFRNVLKFNKNRSPLLYIRGVNNTVLINVVEFLYKGEATVAEKDLEDFLKLSKDLKITGLGEDEKVIISDSADHSIVEEEKVKHTNLKLTSQKENVKWKKDSQQPQLKDMDDADNFIYNLDIVEVADSSTVQNVAMTLQNKNIKKEKMKNQGSQKLKTFADSKDIFDENDYSEINDNTELDAKILEMMEKKDNMWHCKGCGVSKTKKSNIQVHIEINHMNAPQPCTFCDVVSKNRPGLSLHVKKYHSNK